MIDDFQVDNQNLAISHNATQVTLSENAGFTDIIAQLSAYKLRYYTRADDTLFMDEGKGVCLAAQVIAWWNQEAADEEYHVFVPGDTSVYYARVDANPHFVTVTYEHLLDFREAASIVEEHPAQCLVHDSGRLAQQFRDLNVEVSDLRLELFDGAPHSLRYGVNRQQLVMLAALPALGLTIALTGKPLLELVFGTQEEVLPVAIEQAVPILAPSVMPQRLQPDLMALGQIMNRQSLLVLHGLDSLSVTPAQDSFAINAQGSLRPESTVVRLTSIARARAAEFTFDGNNWTMSGVHPRVDQYETPAPSDIYRQLDKWRLTAALHNVSLNFSGRDTLHDAVRYNLQLAMPAPHPVSLQALINDMDRQGLSGEMSHATLTPGIPSGQVWSQLTLDYAITGVEP